MTAPLQLAFYKGVTGKFGAVQFQRQKPHYYCTECKRKDYDSVFPPKEGSVVCEAGGHCKFKSREGAVFVELTSATGKNVYDWSKKIRLALSIQDLGKLLMVLEGMNPEASIMHDPGAQTSTAGQVVKKLGVSSPKGIKEGVLIHASMKDPAGVVTQHMVPLSGDEARVLAICLRHAVVSSLAW